MEEEQVTEPLFDPEEVNDVQTIILLRIYDTVMSQLMLDHPKEGQKLFDLHNIGGLILTPEVRFNPDEIAER